MINEKKEKREASAFHSQPEVVLYAACAMH